MRATTRIVRCLKRKRVTGWPLRYLLKQRTYSTHILCNVHLRIELCLCVCVLDGSLQPVQSHRDASEPPPISLTARSRYHSGSYQSDSVSVTAELFPRPTSDPRRLPLVPLLYVDENGTPVSSEVLRPVPSPSYFTRSTTRMPSAHNAGSFSSKVERGATS